MDVRKEIGRLKSPPTRAIVLHIERTHKKDDLRLRAFKNAYGHYSLSCERMLTEWSLARRFRNGPYYILKYGGAYTAAQRKVAYKFRAAESFLELDFFNVVIHARILLDRTIGLAHFFLPRVEQRPSFASFNDHRKFFLNRSVKGLTDTMYADFVRTRTGWLADTLKEFRDHALVHAQEAAWMMLTMSFEKSEDDPQLWYVLPRDDRNHFIGLPRLMIEIRRFLASFSRLGCSALSASGE